jgi:hypothetical protein
LWLYASFHAAESSKLEEKYNLNDGRNQAFEKGTKKVKLIMGLKFRYQTPLRELKFQLQKKIMERKLVYEPISGKKF